MNKTISINLGGRNFFIEEDAYKKLDAYLSGIRSHFSQYQGSGEIVSDMENRMAEKFEAKYENNPKAVITATDIDGLIAELGTVEDITGEEKKSSGPKSSGWRSSTGKRLMRDGDNKIIAGVASGVAAYFNVDPFVVRFIFGVLLFAWGSIVPIYILLWIIMPEAKTATEKMEMRGEPVNLGSISETIKERAQEFKHHVKNVQDKEQWKEWAGDIKEHSKTVAEEVKHAGQKGGKGLESFFRQIFQGIIKLIALLLKIIAKVIGLVLVVSLSFAMAGLTIGFALALFNSNSPYIGLPLSTIAHGAPYYALLVIAYVIALFPLLLLMLVGTSILNGRKSIKAGGLTALFVIWIVALASGAVVGSRYVPQYVEQIKNSPELQTVNRSYSDYNNYDKVNLSSSIRYKLVQGNEFKIESKGWVQDLDRLEIKNENGTLSINEKDRDFCFFCFSGSPEVTITAPSLVEITATNSSRVQSDKLVATSTSVTLSNSSRLDANLTVKELSLKLSNSSRAVLAGTASTSAVRLSNSSRLDALELQTQDVDITLSNSSRAEVNATISLKYDLSNSSRIYFTGDPVLEGDARNSSREPIPINAPEEIEFPQ